MQPITALLPVKRTRNLTARKKPLLQVAQKVQKLNQLPVQPQLQLKIPTKFNFFWFRSKIDKAYDNARDLPGFFINELLNKVFAKKILEFSTKKQIREDFARK
jgi:hypothetical protein